MIFRRSREISMSASKGFLMRRLFCSAMAVWVMALAPALAQPLRPDTRVTATRGAATLINRTGSRPIRRDDLLTPGDEIETGAGASVTMTLADGSTVTVRPNSHVVIRDFRAAPSARELVQVLIGYVRIKIYRLGGRPNPYKVNTPVASIAVRGTDFSVEVVATGETRVTVFEGRVEVTSLLNPQQKRLLTPGRSVVVRPSGDIGLLAPGPGSELNAVTSYQAPSAFSQVEYTVQGYVQNLILPAAAPTFERFLAFTDSHFDSLENPAFAAQFEKPDGRLYLLSSGAGLQSAIESPTEFSKGGSSSSSIVEQTSFFSPVKDSRIVLGGNLTVAHFNLQSSSSYHYSENGFSTDDIGKLHLTTLSGSFIAARRFGSGGRTSLGLGVDALFGHTERQLRRSFPGPDDYPYILFGAESNAKRARVAIGLAHDFAEGKKLGVYYRYGITGYDDPDSLYGLHVNYRTGASEIGARWRAPLTRRLFYGLHGQLLIDKTTDVQNSVQGLTAWSSARSVNEWSEWRAVFGGGVGYEIRRRTTIAFDVAGGNSRLTYKNKIGDYGNLLPEPQLRARGSNHFLTLHTGGQTDLGRRFFVNGSLFWERKKSTVSVFPPDPRNPFISYLDKTVVNLGPGWRIRQNLDAQYILSWSDVSKNKSHSVMLRYNFGSGDQ